MKLEQYIALIDRQHGFVCDLSDIDGYYLDVPQESWRPLRGNRRGWTRQDIRRRYEFQLMTPPHMREYPPGYRWPTTRVATAARMFDLSTPFEHAASAAIEECKNHPALSDVAALVFRSIAVHREWLDWMRDDTWRDIDARWRDVQRELKAAANALGILAPCARKAEWDRWRNLLTTVNRQQILDVFWLAKSPMSRAEIAPGAGSEFRNLIRQLNDVANRAKPRIPWELRADPKTQKWAKHWVGP
ncbi:hypothetical protein [Crateriforma spongiae]|uniref:hypothetical protein n=1 Tax=Crateriforma spongiae TaxID=2724528 RepID=UPI0039B0C9D1